MEKWVLVKNEDRNLSVRAFSTYEDAFAKMEQEYEQYNFFSGRGFGEFDANISDGKVTTDDYPTDVDWLIRKVEEDNTVTY